MKKDNRNQNVVKYFLAEISADIRSLFKGVFCAIEIPGYVTVKHSDENVVSKIVEYIQKEYGNPIGLQFHSDKHIALYRNRMFNLDGSPLNSNSTGSEVNVRRRISTGEYRFNDIKILRNDSRPCEAKETWIIKDSNGKVIATASILRECWEFVETNFRQ